MAQVLVRDVEPGLIEKLKDRARRNGRSLEAEARAIFRDAVETDPSTIRAEIEQIRALFAGRTFTDSVELLREDRER